MFSLVEFVVAEYATLGQVCLVNAGDITCRLQPEAYQRLRNPISSYVLPMHSVSSPLILRHHSLCRASSPSSPPSKDRYFFKNYTLASQLRTSHCVPVEA